MIAFSNFNPGRQVYDLQLVFVEKLVDLLLRVGVELLPKVINQYELGWQVSALRVSDFGKFTGCIVTNPSPIIMATSNTQLKAMVLDLHV